MSDEEIAKAINKAGDGIAGAITGAGCMLLVGLFTIAWFWLLFHK